MYNLVEICSPIMPYGSSRTIGIRVGGHGISLILAGLHYRLVLAISNCALGSRANCCTPYIMVIVIVARHLQGNQKAG